MNDYVQADYYGSPSYLPMANMNKCKTEIYQIYNTIIICHNSLCQVFLIEKKVDFRCSFKGNLWQSKKLITKKARNMVKAHIPGMMGQNIFTVGLMEDRGKSHLHLEEWSGSIVTIRNTVLDIHFGLWEKMIFFCKNFCCCHSYFVFF